MLRVGLTGGIACGKSVVVRALRAAGIATVDLDDVAHEVMAPGRPAYRKVIDAFGPRVRADDGSIDRGALGAIVFADERARLALNEIVHPAVRAEEAERLLQLENAGHEVAVTDAALLVEAGVHLRFDRLVVVHCSPPTQLRRLRERDRISDAEARARIEAQMPIEEKRAFAHLDVDTEGSLEETDREARRLADVLRRQAAEAGSRVEVVRARAEAALSHGEDRGPRGLSPRVLLEETVGAGGLELVRLATRLLPPSAGPWYRAARPEEGAPWPEALAPALALWSLLRSRDDDWLDAAAASLSRLTHPDGPSVAGACLAARATRTLLAGGALRELPARLDEWKTPSRRWGGASAAARVAAAVEAATRHPRDPAGAWAAAVDAGAEPALAAALVGAEAGRSAGDPSSAALVERLLTNAGRRP